MSVPALPRDLFVPDASSQASVLKPKVSGHSKAVALERSFRGNAAVLTEVSECMESEEEEEEEGVDLCCIAILNTVSTSQP